MSGSRAVEAVLASSSRRWLVTGAAGFIGSHLAEALLRGGQRVVALDNFSTGHRSNLEGVLAAVPGARERFELHEADVRDLDQCRRACEGVELVLHQAALGSVPRSVADPRTSHDVNVTGHMNVLLAAREKGAARVVYASSSSVYGDHPALPKTEENVGRQLSPYAVTKYANELYAHVFGRAYGMELVGLRYFNVFGPRQDPDGPYAAVMPQWFAGLLQGRDVFINGDGETSRDFCHVANVVQANLLAATTRSADAVNRVYNVAFGQRTTLNELFGLIRAQVARVRPEAASARPVFRDFRPGDVRHSLADITRARELLGYEPTHDVAAGLNETAAWYAASVR
jgi:UDP-N-acetylglucosamine 4-epimerase